MWKNSLLEDDQFWETLCYLESLQGELSLKEICRDLNIAREKILEVIYFFHNLNYSFELVEKNGEEYLRPPLNKAKIKLDLKLSEWISMQAHFPFIDQCADKEFHRSLVSKLSSVEKKYKEHDLFNTVPKISCTLDNACNDFGIDNDPYIFQAFNIIENQILINGLISAVLDGEKDHELLPHRIVYLENKLNLVAEDIADRCLVYFRMSNMKKVAALTLSKKYIPNFSNLEVNEFISNVRYIGDSEIRLVLKIKKDYNLNFNKKYHFFGTPYVVTNYKGDRIWAASVEASSDLFHWIRNMGNNVEILDPISFKRSYLEFCKKESQKKSA